MEEKKKIDWDEIEKAGKGKILWLGKLELLNIFVSEQKKFNIHTLIDLPENWRVRDVFYSFERRSFGFLIISDEFSVTSIGAELPELERDKVKKVVGHMTIKT
jgi:hypothetical protein